MEKSLNRISENNRKGLYPFALAVMLVFFFGSMAVCGIVGIEDMDSAGLFGFGYNAIAMLLALVLFVCCILDGMQKDSDRGTFLLLLFFDLIAMALDSFSYCIKGIPALRDVQIVSQAIVFCLDYVLYYQILKYQTMILGVRNTRAVRIVLDVFQGISVFLGITAIANIFTPIYFEINAMGEYSEAAYYYVNSSYRLLVPLAGLCFLVNYHKQIKLPAFS